MQDRERTYDTIVIGGGQAGLIVGHALRERGREFVILDASARVGDSWRHRWDSLRLFTPGRMNGLPGMPFPGPGDAFVGKDQVAAFLEDYARRMDLPVRSGTRVERLSRDGTFVLDTTDGPYRADNVIVAMADYQRPFVPDFATDLDPAIRQLHAIEYKNPAQLLDGPVLVVGLGNSGADIAFDVASSHETTVAGHESGSIPFKIEGAFGRHVGSRLVRFAMIRVLNTSTPIGRRVRPRVLSRPAPLVRVRPKELAAAGVRRVGRIRGIEQGNPVTDDGEVLQVSNVIWCTGYRPGFDWIDLPVFDADLRPRHERGVVEEMPGLYFVGLYFLHAFWSETITGIQPDVEHIVRHLMKRRPAAQLAA